MRIWMLEEFFDIECITDTNEPYFYTCTCSLCGYRFEQMDVAGIKETNEDRCVDHLMKYHLKEILAS